MKLQAPNAHQGTLAVRRLATSAYLSVSVLISIVLIQTGVAVYEAGTGDHLVLSPAGLLRADPSLYLNDYFVRQAVMPHWAFEFYTAISYHFNQLGAMYFAYWIASLAFCAYGHLVLARWIAHRFVYALAISMMTIQLVGVRVMFGTSSVVLNQALPHSLAASIGFVVLGLLLTDRRRRGVAFLVLPFLPLMHIQIGTIVVGVTLLVVLIELAKKERINRAFKVSLGAAFLSIAFGLRYRPIAGNIQDFSQLCKDLAPHHCYAPSWSPVVMTGCFIMLIVGAIGFLCIDNSILRIEHRLAVFLMPTIALGFSLILDRNNVGWLANLVRGNNVYRVAVVILPWLYWVPFLILSSQTRKYFRYFSAVLATGFLGWLILLPEHGNYFESQRWLLLPVAVVLAVVFFLDRTNILSNYRWQAAILMAAFACIPATGSLKFGVGDFSAPKLTFQPFPFENQIGNAVRNDAPKGSVIVGDPVLSWLRMSSGVAFGVDCKFRPIGGGEPLREYYKRINPLGGYDEACNRNSFLTVSSEILTEYFEASRGDLLLIQEVDPRLKDLLASGWKVATSDNVRSFGFVLINRS